MNIIDGGIFFLYMIALLSMGYYFLRRNKSTDDFFVSGRSMRSWHVGLSVVATDVGGGFSIGLGGLGFIMGISGSWMLFTGLIGAWITAVLLIPKVYRLGKITRFTTFPQFFGFLYNNNVAFAAGLISAIGYLGFTSSQILAGAKLASSSFIGLDIQTALIIMGAITIIYTVMGGLTAVIYTDTVQWIILLIGLIFIGIPLSYNAVGGWYAIKDSVMPGAFSLTNVSWQQLVTWAVTIIPIWFVGMTLYQRIYASRSEKDAKRAWFIAGIFEWPVMAFMGVLLGLFARVAADQGMFEALGYYSAEGMDEELGLPLLLRHVLPVGLMGIMMSAYFSAILSTADSCLMAASGNILTDILQRFFPKLENHKYLLRISQALTFTLGVIALFIASTMENVLELMLYSYAFMVSGLFVPLVAALFFNMRNAAAALVSMLSGGFTTVFLIAADFNLPFDLDPNLFGILTSFCTFLLVSYLYKK